MTSIKRIGLRRLITTIDSHVNVGSMSDYDIVGWFHEHFESSALSEFRQERIWFPNGGRIHFSESAQHLHINNILKYNIFPYAPYYARRVVKTGSSECIKEKLKQFIRSTFVDVWGTHTERLNALKAHSIGCPLLTYRPRSLTRDTPPPLRQMACDGKCRFIDATDYASSGASHAGVCKTLKISPGCSYEMSSGCEGRWIDVVSTHGPSNGNLLIEGDDHEPTTSKTKRHSKDTFSRMEDVEMPVHQLLLALVNEVTLPRQRKTSWMLRYSTVFAALVAIASLIILNTTKPVRIHVEAPKSRSTAITGAAANAIPTTNTVLLSKQAKWIEAQLGDGKSYRFNLERDMQTNTVFTSTTTHTVMINGTPTDVSIRQVTIEPSTFGRTTKEVKTISLELVATNANGVSIIKYLP